jgi:hypothetical protein
MIAPELWKAYLEALAKKEICFPKPESVLEEIYRGSECDSVQQFDWLTSRGLKLNLITFCYE